MVEMDKFFDSFLKENGLAAFDELADKFAKELNKARESYVKAQEEEKKKAEAKVQKRKDCVNAVAKALTVYYDKMDPGMVADFAGALLEAIDEGKQRGATKVEVLKDEDTPDGHVKVTRITSSDPEEFWDLLNGKKKKK